MTTTEPTATGTRPAHRHFGWALVLISTAQLMVVLDSTIANIALPYIKSDLGFSRSSLTWVVTGYALAFGGLLLLGGRLGDLYGRRRTFMAGLTTFAVASLLGGVATSEPLLLAARGLQGAGAALASPAALALITTTFPAGRPRQRAFAVYGMMSGLGAAVGMILGGWLTGSHLHLLGWTVDGWRLTFLINVPIGLVAAAIAPAVLAESESHHGELDIAGAVAGTSGLLGIVYGLSRAGDAEYGWGDRWTIASLVAGAACLLVFAMIETHVAHPLLPFRIFANQTRAASFAAMMLMPAAMFSMFYYLSLYVQTVKGYTPLQAGFAFLPFSVTIVLTAGLASHLVGRIDPRFIAGIGTLLSAGALYGFAQIPRDTSFPVAHVEASYESDLLPYIVMMALGMGLTFVPLTLSAVHHVDPRDSGIGSGVLNTMQQVGGALGLATLSTVAQHVMTSTGDQLAAAARRGMAVAAQAGLPLPSAAEQAAMRHTAGLQVFADGAASAFAVGALMVIGASLIIWVFLGVKHEELAAEGPGSTVHLG